METVFIADDEQVIRDGLKQIIDWESFGFTVCGDAANGEEALAKILELNPSLVLIDIRMPKMHGIDVIEAARAKGFNGKIIIISGYSDFKYAQAAIRQGVGYYLTKPVDEDELTSIINEIHTNIIDEHKTSQVLHHYREKAKKEILDELVTGNADIDLINTEEMNLCADVYKVVIYEQYLRDADSMPYQFSELLRVTNNGSLTFEHFCKNDKNVIILKGTYALDKFQRFLDHYDAIPQKDSPLDTLFLAFGRSVNNLSDIALSYSQAERLISRRFFCKPGQHTVGYDALPDFGVRDKSLTNEIMDKYCSTLTNYIQAFNRKMLADTLNNITEYLYDVQDDINAVKLFLTDMFLQIKENIKRLYPTAEIPFPSNSEIIDSIDKQFYLYEIMQYLTSQFEVIMSSIGTSSRDSILDDIIFYIDHNFQTNIKLETIAPLFGYNSAYLGKIFSKNVGENFNNYVDHIRIEHAKKLISENKLKVYEISEQVGYKNVDYFHKKFKKYVGVSPAEYRKQFCSDSETN
jgi:two-component system response regulator YesN